VRVFGGRQMPVDASLQGKHRGKVAVRLLSYTSRLVESRCTQRCQDAGTDRTGCEEMAALGRVQATDRALCDEPLPLGVRGSVRMTSAMRTSVLQEAVVGGAREGDRDMPPQSPWTAIFVLDGAPVPSQAVGAVAAGRAEGPGASGGGHVATAAQTCGSQWRVGGSHCGQGERTGFTLAKKCSGPESLAGLRRQGDQVLGGQPVLVAAQPAQGGDPGGRAIQPVGQAQEQAWQGLFR
jgi:hypothetical protein